MLKQLLNFFIPVRKNHDEEIYRRDKIAVTIVFFGIIYCILNMTVSAIAGFYFNLFSFIPLLFIVASALFIFRRTGNIILCVNLIAVAADGRLVPSIYLLGGIYSVALSLLLITPIVVLLLLGSRAGILWMGINMIIVLGFFLLSVFHVSVPVNAADSAHALLNLFLVIALLFMMIMTVRTFERTTKRARKELAEKNVALNHSLSELKKAEAQLIQSEKMASLGLLTAGVAHEINNPINFVSASISPLKRNIDEIMQLLEEYASLNKNNFSTRLDEILKRRDEIDLNYTVEEIKSLIKGIDDGSKRTAEIVQGLRTFSSINQEEMKQVNVNEEVESVLALFQTKLEKSNIELVKSFAEIQEIESFPIQLHQALINLILNGIESMNENGKLFVSTSVENNHAIISIRDTGKGITPQVKQKIFDPFFTTKDVGKGIGLGLSIVYRIIENHGGKIEVESETGKGTEFKIILPVSHQA